MAYGIDASVHSMQAPRPNSPIDLFNAHAIRKQLKAGHYAVLPTSERGKPSVIPTRP